MRKSKVIVLGFAVLVVGCLMWGGLVTSAQNSNSSTTAANTNAPAKRKPRRHKPKPKAAEDGTDTATATTAPAPPPPRTGRCDPNQQEQTDLSGTYAGRVKHGDEAEMDGTLTITGNKFTMAAGSDTHSGTITAVTTCNYTAVTVMPDGAPRAMSLRAKRVGNSLTLTSVPGEPQQVKFTTSGGAMKAKPRRHKTKKAVPAPPPPPQQ